MNRLLFALKTLFRRNKMEASMRAEMQQHIELQAAEYEAQGLSKTEALRKARKAFGNQTYLQENCRASWGMRLVDEFTNDVHFALKQLRKHPLFATVAILSLGIGIGINLTLFSALNALLFKPLPLDHPEQLRELHTKTPLINGYSSGTMIHLPDGSLQFNGLSYPVFREFRDQSEPIAKAFCWANTYSFLLDNNGTKRTDRGLLISDNYFEALGITPLLGKIHFDQDEEGDPTRRMWISTSIWKKDFSENPSIIGETLIVENQVFTIAGVIPSEFGGLEKGQYTNFYFPLEALTAFDVYPELLAPSHFFLRCGIRLKNVLFEEDLKNLLSEALRNVDVPYQPNPNSIIPEVLLFDASLGISSDNTHNSKNLMIPMVMSGILLLVSCVNLAGLQFSRNYNRIRELNIRASVGASRGRLIRQFMTETLILCLAGAVNGIVLAILSYKWLNLQFVYSIDRIDSTPDFRVFALFAGLITLCTILVGLYPTLRVTRFHHNLHTNQKAGGTAQASRIGKMTITIQIICAISLIYTAFLFGKSLHNLTQTDLGFNPNNLLVFNVDGEDTLQQTNALVPIEDEILDTIIAIPGVATAARANLKLLSNSTNSTTLNLSLFQPDQEEKIRAYRMGVSTDFFDTLDIPMMSGNGFDPNVEDRNTGKVIISESLAKKAFPTSNAIGRSYKSNSKTWTIIGVCGDIHYHSLRESSKYLIYSSVTDDVGRCMSRSNYFYVRTQTSPLSMSKTIRKCLEESYSGIIIKKTGTVEKNIENLVSSERNISILSALFSCITVVLTCIGLFAQVSFDVASRTHEIGVRLAMGATRKKMIRHMLRRGISPLLPGLLIGIPIAITVKRYLGDTLFEISLFEPMGILIAISLVLTTTLLAAAIPSFRSSRLDPSEVLRSE